MMIKRTSELRREVKGLAARIAHLVKEAREVEDGKVDEKEKQDADHNPTGYERTRKFQPSAAVGYWREIREHEERLDRLRAELRALEAAGDGKPVQVEIHFDGPESDT